MKTIDARTKSI